MNVLMAKIDMKRFLLQDITKKAHKLINTFMENKYQKIVPVTDHKNNAMRVKISVHVLFFQYFRICFINF